jgi:sugar lactone lactonase YvrE
MVTQVMGTTFRYSHTIGRGEQRGPGFRTPVSMALAEGDLMYVVSRASEYRPDSMRITMCTVDEEYVGEFANGGDTAGIATETESSMTWPAGSALDKAGNLYVADEWRNQIVMFTKDGEVIGRWGETGSANGQLDGPNGLAFDADDNLLVVDGRNHRVQKFTKQGKFLSTFGSQGNRNGQFNLPWGITVDHEGNIWVADWRNDRVQKFSKDGKFLAKIGASGTKDGQLNRPTGVAVDREGYLYVTDWGNDRVQVFDAEGRFSAKLLGEGGISKWGKEKLDANPDMWLERQVAQNLEEEKKFWAPISVKVDDKGRIFIVESARQRIQVYRKISPYFLGMYDNGRL